MYVPRTESEFTSGFESAIGITCASNWQYTKVFPTDLQWQFQEELS